MVENKIDLLDGDAENDPEFQQFAQDNGFCGSFRTSAKTGININESMEYLIRTIIKRVEDMGNEVFTTERKSIKLDPERHTQAAIALKRKRDARCC